MNPFVRLKAEQTLKSLGIFSAPIDPIAIAVALGLTVRREFFNGDLSGVLMRKNGAGIIAVNASDPPARQRFTIAHELGHFVLEHQGDVFVDHTIMNRRDSRSSAAVDLQEIEANAFAAELLMPGELVASDVARLLNFCEGIDQPSMLRELASKFYVSEQAMSFRLMNLGILT